MCNYGRNHCPGCGKCILDENLPDYPQRGARCYACLGRPLLMKFDPILDGDGTLVEVVNPFRGTRRYEVKREVDLS